MSYLQDTIDWQAIRDIDKWLDDGILQTEYASQPLALDWTRISKVIEELGECIQAFIGYTAANPRKGLTHTREDVLDELADTALTAILAIQHFTKDTRETRQLIRDKVSKIERRIQS